MTIRSKTVLLTGMTVAMTLLTAQADDADLSVLRETSVHRIGTTTITLSSPKVAAFANWEEFSAESTTIEFDKDVRINGNWVAAGSYGLRLQRVAENDLHVVLDQSFSTGKIRDAKRSDEVLRLAVRPVEALATDSPSVGIIIRLEEEEEEEEDRDENAETEEDEAQEEEGGEDEDGEEEEDYEEENRFAELYFHWGTRRAAVRLVMTGMRRRATPAPEMPKPVRTPWSVVFSSLEALVAEDLEKHIEDFAEDFESSFDDGGSALAHAQLLGHFRRGGGLEGLLLNLDQVTWTADERSAEFRNIVIFTAEDRLVFTYRLVKTGDGWKTVNLSAE